jgi:hypothetical protein
MQTLHPVLSSQAEEPISEKWTFLNGKTLKAIAGLVVSLVVGLVIAFGILNLKPPAALRDGQLLAREIAKAAARSDSVPVASGTYVPGNGIILYSQVAYNSDTQIFLWLSTQLQAQGERLAQMPSNETLTWIVDYRLPVGSGPDLAEQKVLQAPLSRAGDPALHQYIDSPSEIASSPAAQPETAEVPVEVVQVQAKPAQPETIAEAAAAPSEAKFVDEAPALQTDAAGVAPLVESVEQESPLFASNFIENDAGWRPLSGEWQVIEGAYRQNNATGYDFISMIDTNRLTDYSLETKFRFIEAEMGGGLIYHAPSMDTGTPCAWSLTPLRQPSTWMSSK